VKSFCVTTPIYYVNDAPHVGHAYTTLHADVFARWHRLIGDEVFFLTGTDEHGLKIAEAAEKQGVDPQALTDVTSQRFKDVWAKLLIQYDDFIRTTDERHIKAVKAFTKKIYDSGYIVKDTWEGLYCISCESNYTEAESENGLCPIHKRKLESVKEDNYFFKLSEFEDRLIKYYSENPKWIEPETKYNEAFSFIKSGLKDISITRSSFDWGISVPWDETQVFYVWFEALINYVTALGYESDSSRFSNFWPNTVHLIGKEITRFHCVWWPAMCMAAGIDPPSKILVHGWLLVKGEKMSKSGLNKIDPSELVDEFGLDQFRYLLIKGSPFGPDSEFSYEELKRRNNSDLANNLGNLLSRVVAVVHSKCDGISPKCSSDSELKQDVEDAVEAAVLSWNNFAPADALEAVWNMIKRTNFYLEKYEPWKLEPGDRINAIMGDSLEVLRIVSILISPVMPTAACDILRRIGLKIDLKNVDFNEEIRWGQYLGGVPVIKDAPLFARIK
jgi:methionyl-tRNA synthetase